MTDDVSRPEFDGAIESLRREIRAMGESVGRDLQRVSRQLEDLVGARAEEARLIGQLTSDVENLKEWKMGAVASIRMLQVGLIVTVAGAILAFLLRAH